MTDPSQYDASLVEALAARLGAEICYAITGSTSMVQIQTALYESKMTEARTNDATEGATQRLRQATLLKAGSKWRSAPAFSSFTAGEISPRLEGRTNIEKYTEGLSDLTNMVVMPHGGVTRRPGTEFLGEVSDSSVKTRLIPFQFKTSDTYILEFGDQTMRVYRDDLSVLMPLKKHHSYYKADPGVLTSSRTVSAMAMKSM